MSKGLMEPQARNASSENLSDGVVDEKRGTAGDRADMIRMGKPQDLRVRKPNSGHCNPY